MNSKNPFINFVIVAVIVFLILVSASVLGREYCATAEISDISPSSIGIGEEFTVGVQIENCGEKIPEDISFELLNPPTDIAIKEPLIINISRLNWNSERFIIYHMRTSNDAQPGTYVIKTRLSYGGLQYSIIENYNIVIDVIGDKAELSVASLKTEPVLPRKGDTVELTLRIENTGDGTAKAVSVYADHPFQGLKQSFIGALDSNEDGPAVLTFIVDKVGEFELPITISYKDDFGDNEIKTNVNLNILKKKSNIGAILFTILILAVLGWGIYYFLKTKKAKDNIIQQLLKGENFKVNKKEEEGIEKIKQFFKVDKIEKKIKKHHHKK